ncbi:MAG: helix-turn-helix transcriptional regulator [Chthoniobacterales bacterium]|nr:helix-turn-helix transcriptional regulator [Chthoniobacterales bacterium]
MRLSKGLSIKDAAAQLQTGRPVWNLSETGLQHLEARRRAITDSELVTLLRLYGKKLADLD